MSYDDFNTPLGQFVVPEHSPRAKTLAVVAVLGAAGLFTALTLALLEPVRLPPMASIAANVSPPPATVSQKTESIAARTPSLPRPAPEDRHGTDTPQQDPVTGASAGQAGEGLEAVEKRSGVKVIRAGGGIVPEPLVIDVAKALDVGAVAGADPRVTEQSHYGPIPRIGADGARPSKVYARAAPATDGEGRAPRIALLVGGVGLAPRATETAISKLPAGVTLGFAPYGTGVARQAALAREAGHEIILQVPMEPFDFPRDNPGPHVLLARAGKAGNIDNLTWAMSRFAGYAGVMNFLGGRFTADAKALAPVLGEIAARGLFYLDDGTSSQSLAMALAPDLGLAASRADVIVDSTAQPEAVEAALARLEAIAREKGMAIGVASALPASILAIGRFAQALESRGVSLIPLSAAIENLQSAMADSSPVR